MDGVVVDGAGPAPNTTSAPPPVDGSAAAGALTPADDEEAILAKARQAFLRSIQVRTSHDPPKHAALSRTTHRSFLLQEMSWMAVDFAQERLWKQTAARKLARACAEAKRERDARNPPQPAAEEAPTPAATTPKTSARGGRRSAAQQKKEEAAAAKAEAGGGRSTASADA